MTREPNSDRDAGGGWRRQFAAQVMQTGGSGLSSGWAPSLSASAPYRSTASVVAARAAASTSGELQVAPAVSEHQRRGGSAFCRDGTHAMSLGVHTPSLPTPADAMITTAA